MKTFLLSIFFCFASVMSFSQDNEVKGTVSDKDGIPLPGVSVVVKNTTNGVNTDFDGNFSLSNVQSGETLVFSYIGFIPQEVVIQNFNSLSITLQEDVNNLEEVVVVGYGVQKKALVTGASVNIKGEDIAALNTGSAMEALQGITPGVSITRNNGAPGAGTKVTIRGLGTVGNSNPLFIVDGVAVGNIDYLGASDIEAIDVLKDAASAAIYGSRAANGVILVTTKRGRKNSPARVEYDSYYGIQNIYKNLDPLNAQEYMYIMDEGRLNDGLAPTDWEGDLHENPWLADNFSDNLDQQLGDEIWGMLQNGWKGTNWIDEISKKDAAVQNHSLNISGGSEDITYSMGINYFDQEGIIGGSITNAGYKRITTRLNTEFVLFKNDEHSIVTIGENFTYTNVENRSVATGNIYWNDLHNALVQNPLMPAYWQQSIDYNIDANGFTPSLYGVSNGQANPIAVMFNRHNYSNLGNKNNTIVGNVYLEIEPMKNLKFRSAYGIDAWFGHTRSMFPTFALGNLYSNATERVEQGQYFGNNINWQTTVSYEHLFGDHKVNALLGYEVIKNQINTSVGGGRSNTAQYPGSPDHAYIQNYNSPTNVNEIYNWGVDWAAGGGGILSYIARAQYNFKEKYLLTATFRRDGSSNFAEGNRFGNFPSVSAGWILTQEDFMDSTSNFLDFAKIRVSWGQNGNQSIPAFRYSANIASAFPGYFFGDTKPVSGPTSFPENVPNPDLKWETSEQINIGLDARFLSSRLALTLDWYKKTTVDWLVLPAIQGTFGAGAPWVNGGDIENTGIEAMISWNDTKGDFNYGITLSGAHNKNEVTRIDNGDKIIHGPSHVLSQGTAEVSRAEVGYPIGYFYGYETDGIIQNQDEAEAYVTPGGSPYFSNQRPGDVRFVDQNLDGVIDEADKKMLGNPNPDFELGIQLNVEYKGFYANTTLAGKFGMQVMQSYRSFADSGDQNYTSQVFNRWHGEGTSNRMPRLSAISNRNTNFISDIYMHDADYLRINNLTVGYSLADMLESIDYIRDIKIYVACNNLYTFTSYDGMDPEVRFGHDASWASGIDLGLYPLPRTVMFGLSLDF